jgi:hypothetical protein
MSKHHNLRRSATRDDKTVNEAPAVSASYVTAERGLRTPDGCKRVVSKTTVIKRVTR